MYDPELAALTNGPVKHPQLMGDPVLDQITQTMYWLLRYAKTEKLRCCIKGSLTAEIGASSNELVRKVSLFLPLLTQQKEMLYWGSSKKSLQYSWTSHRSLGSSQNLRTEPNNYELQLDTVSSQKCCITLLKKKKINFVFVLLKQHVNNLLSMLWVSKYLHTFVTFYYVTFYLVLCRMNLGVQLHYYFVNSQTWLYMMPSSIDLSSTYHPSKTCRVTQLRTHVQHPIHRTTELQRKHRRRSTAQQTKMAVCAKGKFRKGLYYAPSGK